MKLAVLGAGAWGTALALTLARRHAVSLWARDANLAAILAASRRNERYLPGFELPPHVQIGADIERALEGAEAALCAVPVAGLRELLARMPRSETPLVLACKGFEPGNGLLPHEVVEQVLPGRAVGVLSGPSFAAEVAAHQPSAVVLAAADPAFAGRMARALHDPRLRVYSNDDLIGVEIAGAAKNVMAIAVANAGGDRHHVLGGARDFDADQIVVGIHAQPRVVQRARHPPG